MSEWLHPQDPGYPFEEVMSHHRTSRGNAMSSETTEPLSPEEEAKFRKSVEMLGDGGEYAPIQWSNTTANRLLATLDRDRAALQASKTPDSREDRDQHKPGDPHRYDIECRDCGQRGMIRLTVDPETAPDSREGGEA